MFAGDALFTSEILKKHNNLPFNVTIEEVFNTLRKLENIQVNRGVLGHSSIITKEQLSQVIRNYQDVIIENLNIIRKIISKAPITQEQVIAEVLSYRGVSDPSKGLFYLLKTTILAYLSYLEGLGEIESQIVNGKVKYKNREG
ncbi:hypothetical protein [Natranaerobius trueperi]|uniref:Uncharacterized protein n=1 Tax=Natranaerobius trueperi TaxID=759412 RepID=A0A226BXR1_9FIRM|nr:hypothetical protein [Natranaerobius trueperi]OWZ83711.1 hypothetical protein CDO51_07090 [Natranaerobius trueperi]